MDSVDQVKEVAAARNGNRRPFFPRRCFPIVDMIVDVYFVENRIIVEKDNNDIDHNSFLCSRTLPVGLGVSENEYFDLILVICCPLSSCYGTGVIINH